MNYPLILDYIEAIKSAEDNFNELSYLRPVLGNDGQPVMSSGNFAVVFKMKDVRDDKLYAVKCFTKEQDGRSESYKLIADELEFVSSNYLISIRYLEKELFVDTDQTDETEFPVLLMDWVDGEILDKYIRNNKKNKFKLEQLSYKFYKLSTWLISKPFAHGDLKLDNIIIRDNGDLVLIDYDGMYVPAMRGQAARELGSQDFRSPYRNQLNFSRDIDDFAIISILLSLCMIHINPNCLDKYGAQDRLVFSALDYKDIRHSKAYHAIPHMIINNTNYKLLLQFACEEDSFSFSNNKYVLTRLLCPTKNRRAIPVKVKELKEKEDNKTIKDEEDKKEYNEEEYYGWGGVTKPWSELDDYQKPVHQLSNDNSSKKKLFLIITILVVFVGLIYGAILIFGLKDVCTFLVFLILLGLLIMDINHIMYD